MIQAQAQAQAQAHNVAYQNSNFPKIGLTLPYKKVFKC